MLADCPVAHVGQLRRQLQRHRLSRPGAAAVRGKAPRIGTEMTSHGRIDLFQRCRPPRQIQVMILHATAAPLFDPLLRPFHEGRAADGVPAGGHRLQQLRVVLQEAGLDVRAVLPPSGSQIAAILPEHVVVDKLLGLGRRGVAPITAPGIGFQATKPLLPLSRRQAAIFSGLRWM